MDNEPPKSVADESHASQLNLARFERRLSMDEDLFYHRVMSAPSKPSSLPPPYQPSVQPFSEVRDMRDKKIPDVSDCPVSDANEELPAYSNSIHLEGVFSKKHEIENTTKRAEDRRWHNAYLVLHGTSLQVYHVKRDWGWGKTRDGPSICPDNPPWIKRSRLEKSYSLMHADAGIAADYKKRRYVIRIRAETDQFLISCVELGTFVKWLESLFAAIDVAAPIDERDFPRDMSIPRVQRIRWFRGQSPVRCTSPASTQQSDDGIGPTATQTSTCQRSLTRQSSISSNRVQLSRPVSSGLEAEAEARRNAVDSDSEESTNGSAGSCSRTCSRGPRLAHRLSTTSYHNASIDPFSGKWFPEHRWSEAHDMIYAKLCYSNLLFRSPRRSNYIISKGKQWFVDWTTGRMVRVLPPAYDDEHLYGPWQVIHTENSRI